MKRKKIYYQINFDNDDEKMGFSRLCVPPKNS